MDPVSHHPGHLACLRLTETGGLRVRAAEDGRWEGRISQGRRPRSAKDDQPAKASRVSQLLL